MLCLDIDVSLLLSIYQFSSSKMKNTKPRREKSLVTVNLNKCDFTIDNQPSVFYIKLYYDIISHLER